MEFDTEHPSLVIILNSVIQKIIVREVPPLGGFDTFPYDKYPLNDWTYHRGYYNTPYLTYSYYGNEWTGGTLSPPTIPYHLQNPKWPLEGPQWPSGSGKVSTPRLHECLYQPERRPLVPILYHLKSCRLHKKFPDYNSLVCPLLRLCCWSYVCQDGN